VWVQIPPPVLNLRRKVDGYLLDGHGNTPGVALGWHWPFRSMERLASSGEVTTRRPDRDHAVREFNLDLQAGRAKGSDADDRALKLRIRSSRYIMKRQATMEDHPVRVRAQRRDVVHWDDAGVRVVSVQQWNGSRSMKSGTFAHLRPW